MPAHFKAVLFDLDGTLVDSAPDLVAAVNSLRRDLGLPEIIYEALRGRAGHGIRGLVWSALRIRKEDPPFAGLSDAFLTHYEAHIHDGTHPFAGVEAMLTALTRRGIAWGIVTNKPERLAKIVVGNNPVISGARCVIGWDTVGKMKPAPDSLILAMKTLGVMSSEVLYVGDDARDTLAAHNAGCRAAAALWGYTTGNTQPADWGSDFLLKSPAELLNLLSEPVAG